MPTMSFTPKHAARLSLIAVAAISVAACQSRPKPAGPAPTTPTTSGQTTPSGPSTPSTQGPVTSGVIPGSTQDFAQNAGDRVFFDLDSHELRDDAIGILDAQAAWLARYPNVQVRIEGNADERGTREYNIALGARRASAVREYLSTKGLSPSRMSTISYGKEKPIDPGTSEESHARNRNAGTVIISGAR